MSSDSESFESRDTFEGVQSVDDEEPLLHSTIRNGSQEEFDALLQSPAIRVDYETDFWGKTPLMLACSLNKKYHVSELIRKGADINKKDNYNSTPLHYAIRSVEICEELIAEGADIDAINDYGETPFLRACGHNLNSRYVFLFNGANPFIANSEGENPLDVAVRNASSVFAETFLLFYFDKFQTRCPLKFLFAALRFRFDIVWDILNTVNEFLYEENELGSFWGWDVFSFDNDQLLAFFRKFSSVAYDLLNYFNPLNVKYHEDSSDYMYFLYKLDTEFLLFIIERYKYCYQVVWDVPIYPSFFRFLTQDQITIIYCYLLSQGATLSNFDLELVYEYFGCRELFEMLLHMDFVISAHVHPNNNDVIPRIIYDVHINFDTFIPYCIIDVSPENFRELAKFFVHPFLASNYDHHFDGPNLLPTVPSLLQLSREVTRKYLFEQTQIKSNVGFFTVLKCLPISRVYKDILCYKMPIYIPKIPFTIAKFQF